jgi:YihY family inner membrane protein
VSAAALVPETWELDGDDARETLLRTGRVQLARDAFVRLRAADGFSHARSMAYLVSLVLVQGVIGCVGLASAWGSSGPSTAIRRTIHLVAPGQMGRVVVDAVNQAYRAGTSGRWFALVFGLVGALVTGTTLMGQVERALNRLYGIEQDRPTVEKYAHGFVVAVTAGALALGSLLAFAFGQALGDAIGSGAGATAWKVARWPLALALAAAAIALLFRQAPHRHQPAWSWLAFGSTVSVLLWSIVTFGLGLFIRLSSSFGEAYGPLAGVVALLLWSLCSSVAVLYGAAIAAELEAVRAGAPAPRDPEKQLGVPADERDDDLRARGGVREGEELSRGAA